MGTRSTNFVVQYPHDQFHYKFDVSKDGKVDELLLRAVILRR